MLAELLAPLYVLWLLFTGSVALYLTVLWPFTFTTFARAGIGLVSNAQ